MCQNSRHGMSGPGMSLSRAFGSFVPNLQLYLLESSFILAQLLQRICSYYFAPPREFFLFLQNKLLNLLGFELGSQDLLANIHHTRQDLIH